MKFIPGLLKQNLLRWQGKTWYHQRFDGSPYLLHLIAEAEILPDRRTDLSGDVVHYCFFHEGKADWYILMDDIQKISAAVIAEGRKNPALGKTLIEEWKPAEEKFYAF